MQENSESTSFDALIEILSSHCGDLDGKEKIGTALEKAAKLYLSSHKSAVPLKSVWLWKEAGNPLNPEGAPDSGIDIVGEDSYGNYYSAQVRGGLDEKEALSAKDIESFMVKSESEKIPGDRRIMVLFKRNLKEDCKKDLDRVGACIIDDSMMRKADLNWSPVVENL